MRFWFFGFWFFVLLTPWSIWDAVLLSESSSVAGNPRNLRITGLVGVKAQAGPARVYFRSAKVLLDALSGQPFARGGSGVEVESSVREQSAKHWFRNFLYLIDTFAPFSKMTASTEYSVHSCGVLEFHLIPATGLSCTEARSSAPLPCRILICISAYQPDLISLLREEHI